MVGLTNEEVNLLTQYAEENVFVSVPLIQREFGWSYSKARGGVEKLVELKLLKYDEGIFYTYTVSHNGKDDEEPDDIDFDFDDYFEEDLEDVEDIVEDLKNADSSLLGGGIKLDFNINIEKEIVRKSLDMMNKLEVGANKGRKEAENGYKPKNAKLPNKYENLPQETKELVEFVVKNAYKLSGARVGLYEGRKRWRSSSQGAIIYDRAIKFIGNLTEAEFKRIKYILADG